jgi:hypothetical protein
MTFRPFPLADDLADPDTALSAVMAALSACLDQEFNSDERARYVDLLDKVYFHGKNSNEPAPPLRRVAKIAAVASILFRGPRDGIARLRPLPPDSARKRLAWALSKDELEAPLPAIVGRIAIMLEPLLPPAADEELSATVLSGFGDSKALDDFKPYKRLLQPIPLVPAPDSWSLTDSLNYEFPWMTEATETVSRNIRLAEYCGRRYLKFRPVLLVGEAGVGKTRWAQRLAAHAGCPFRLVAAGGSTDSMSLRGTSKGWNSARPSAVLQLILQGLAANPCILVDEICKAADSENNGSLRATLLSLLEPSTAKLWFDEAFDAGCCDLSYVNYIATANSLEPLSKPLLDRFDIVLVRPPEKHHYPRIIRSILTDIAAEHGLSDARMLPTLDAYEETYLIENCGNVRQLARAVRRALQDKVAARIEMVH